MHECSVELYHNFVVKPKQSFPQPTQTFVFHWYFVDFLMTFTETSLNLRPLTTTQMLSTERGKIHLSVSQIWSTNVIQGQNRSAQWLISDLHPKECAGSLIRWSVCRSLRSVIRWILVQSGFDRSLIWKRIRLKAMPQIRNPDPDSPKGMHPKDGPLNYS